METRFKERLEIHFAEDGIKKHAYIREKIKAQAYDRLFDGVEVLDATTKEKMKRKIQELHNALYYKAKCRVAGFRRLSEFNIDQYNATIAAPYYKDFEERVEKFIKEEVLDSESELWRKIETVVQELMQKACEEILDEEGMIHTNITKVLGITGPDLEKMRDQIVIQKIINSFAAESVRQVDWSLRTLPENYKARETPCGIRVFDGIERGFQQAISGNIPQQKEDESPVASDQPNWNLTAIQRLFNSQNASENKITTTLTQWGRSLFGPR